MLHKLLTEGKLNLMLEPLGMLGGYIIRLFTAMVIGQRMAASGYWFWGVIVLVGIVFVAVIGSGFWQLAWLVALGILELAIIASGAWAHFTADGR